jgi:pimeloyl-ACP methyl ester carboxylesterase
MSGRLAWWLAILLLAGLAVVAIGCGDDDDDDNDAAGDDDDNNTDGDDDTADDDTTGDDDTPLPTIDELIAQVEVTWESCSLYEGYNDGRAECALVEMPMDWRAPDGRTFTVAAKRLLTGNKAAARQVWLLHGGPGASGTIDYPPMMEYLAEEDPNLDVYTIDARGTGYSEFLYCPHAQSSFSAAGTSLAKSEIPGCIDELTEAYGADLAVYSTTNSAIDLAALIEHSAPAGQDVFVYGASGGTFWAQRYLQFFPDQADGVIIEAIEPADGSIAFQDEYADKTVRAVFELCAADATCSTKLPTPEATLKALYTKLDSGHCASLGVDAITMKVIFDQFAYYYPLHFMLPALVYRVDRCTDEDIAAVAQAVNIVFGGKGGPKADDDPGIDLRSFSEVVFFQQLASELWAHKSFPTNDDLVAYLDGVYLDTLIGYRKGYDRNDIVNQWPVYHDEADDQWAETDVPMLMLNGMIDPSTPYDFALTMADHFTGEHQTFLGFPNLPHGVTTSSPVDPTYGDYYCGLKLWLDFMVAPEQPLDTSCLDHLEAPDLVGTYWGPLYMGADDYWEGGPTDRIEPLGANPAKFAPPHAPFLLPPELMPTAGGPY